MSVDKHYSFGPIEVWRFLNEYDYPRFTFERWLWSDGRWINKPRLRIGRYVYCAAWWTNH